MVPVTTRRTIMWIVIVAAAVAAIVVAVLVGRLQRLPLGQLRRGKLLATVAGGLGGP
jgi:hypothetical protein